MNEFADAFVWFTFGCSLTFVYCTYISRSEHSEWSQLTDRLIAVIEKLQAEQDDADWWKNSNEENESDEQ